MLMHPPGEAEEAGGMGEDKPVVQLKIERPHSKSMNSGRLEARAGAPVRAMANLTFGATSGPDDMFGEEWQGVQDGGSSHSPPQHEMYSGPPRTDSQLSTDSSESWLARTSTTCSIASDYTQATSPTSSVSHDNFMSVYSNPNPSRKSTIDELSGVEKLFKRSKTGHFDPITNATPMHHYTFPIEPRIAGKGLPGSASTLSMLGTPLNIVADRRAIGAGAGAGASVSRHLASGVKDVGAREIDVGELTTDAEETRNRTGEEAVKCEPIGQGSVDPSTPHGEHTSTPQPVSSSGDCSSSGDGAQTPGSQETSSPSDSDGDSNNSDEAAFDDLSDESHDRFVRAIYNVIVEHTAPAVLDDLEEPLKAEAYQFAERVINLAQANLNKQPQIRCDDSNMELCTETPSDKPTPTYPANKSGESSHQGQRTSKKRSGNFTEQSEDGSEDEHGSRDGFPGGGGGAGDGKDSSGGHGARKRKKAEPDQNSGFSCPFRKRNPVRFNIRKHQSCALHPFADMPRLKRHIKDCHKTGSNLAKHVCPRCKKAFETEQARDKHINVPVSQICDSRVDGRAAGDDPENGISPDVDDQLCARGNGKRVDSWRALWLVLFPGDQIIPPSDFEPPVDLEEVDDKFRRDKLSHVLLRRMGQLQLASLMADDASTACIRYIDDAMAACRAIPHLGDQSSMHVDAPVNHQRPGPAPPVSHMSSRAGHPEGASTPRAQLATAGHQPSGQQNLLPTPESPYARPSRFTPASSSSLGFEPVVGGLGQARGPPPAAFATGGMAPPTPPTPTANGTRHRTIAPATVRDAKVRAANSRLRMAPPPALQPSFVTYGQDQSAEGETLFGFADSERRHADVVRNASPAVPRSAMRGHTPPGLSAVAAGKRPVARLAHQSSTGSNQTVVYSPNNVQSPSSLLPPHDYDAAGYDGGYEPGNIFRISSSNGGGPLLGNPEQQQQQPYHQDGGNRVVHYPDANLMAAAPSSTHQYDEYTTTRAPDGNAGLAAMTNAGMEVAEITTHEFRDVDQAMDDSVLDDNMFAYTMDDQLDPNLVHVDHYGVSGPHVPGEWPDNGVEEGLTAIAAAAPAPELDPSLVGRPGLEAEGQRTPRPGDEHATF